MVARATRKKSGLTDAQVQQYREQGYVIVPDLFDPADLEPLRQELAARIDAKIEDLARQGKLTDKHVGESFELRTAKIYADSEENGVAIMRDIEGVAGGGHTGIAMFRTITHPNLLAAIESLVGPEIVASSVYRIRPKVPGKVRGVVPWHQDSGYFAQQCDEHLIVTCWIPLVNATVENGCMQVLPKAHQKGIATHRTGGNAGFLVIEDDALPNSPEHAVTAECPLGGVVLMTNLTPHCSTPNFTDIVRWSIDLRYQSAAVPNNVDLVPDVEAPATPELLMACYPPEADFVVQSLSHPERVATYEQYNSMRQHYDRIKQKAYPQRDWKPVGTPK